MATGRRLFTKSGGRAANALSLLILSMLILLLLPTVLGAEEQCGPEPGRQQAVGLCSEPTGSLLFNSGASLLQLNPAALAQPPVQSGGNGHSGAAARSAQSIPLLFFHGRGCPHCEKERQFLDKLQRSHPALRIKAYEVWYDKQNAALLSSLLQARGMRLTGVPVTFIDREVYIGFSPEIANRIIRAVEQCNDGHCTDPRAQGTKQSGATGTTGLLNIPLLGRLDARAASLPVITVVIAALDSVNPCAFFVLLTLLGLLSHARSRNKMLLVGGVFVFFSGFIYFLFMAAWLNLFLVMGRVALLTTIAGAVALVIAAINIKDFFAFRKGVSLTIPERAKPRLYERMRSLLRSASLPAVLFGAAALAIAANAYELLCTAGFPMVYTRILTLRNLPLVVYYLYLLAYAVIYVLPLFLIVTLFTVTLGGRKLTEQQGRALKLLSGMMMLGLGAVLVLQPALLNSVVFSLFLLVGAGVLSFCIVLATRKIEALRLHRAG